MRTIYLIRHGIPEGEERERKLIGVTDPPLSLKGKREIEKLGIYFGKKQRLFRIFTSPLSRCIATTEIIAEKMSEAGMWVEKTEMCGEFREINLGRWENLTAEEIREKYPKQYEERGRRIWMYRTPEGETFQEVADRFMSALNDIRKRCDEETNLGDGPDILAVAHAGVIRAYISRLTGRDGNRLFWKYLLRMEELQSWLIQGETVFRFRFRSDGNRKSFWMRKQSAICTRNTIRLIRLYVT